MRRGTHPSRTCILDCMQVLFPLLWLSLMGLLLLSAGPQFVILQALSLRPVRLLLVPLVLVSSAGPVRHPGSMNAKEICTAVLQQPVVAAAASAACRDSRC